MAQTFCVSCQKKTDDRSPSHMVSKRKTHMVKSKCSQCGKGKCRVMSKREAQEGGFIGSLITAVAAPLITKAIMGKGQSGGGCSCQGATCQCVPPAPAKGGSIKFAPDTINSAPLPEMGYSHMHGGELSKRVSRKQAPDSVAESNYQLMHNKQMLMQVGDTVEENADKFTRRELNQMEALYNKGMQSRDQDYVEMVYLELERMLDPVNQNSREESMISF